MELRKDYLTEEWVCLSEIRALRPATFKRGKSVAYEVGQCPFCAENKSLTPPELYILDDIRVIPNKYPAVHAESEEGYGFHEVIVDSPLHDYSLIDGDIDQIVKLFTCIRHRLIHHNKNERIAYVQLFQNWGPKAGASIYHSHWQLMALPFVPFIKGIMQSNFDKHKNEHGSCYLCETAKTLASLIIYETDDVVAYCPYAALYHYSVNIMTKHHLHDFSEANKNTLTQLAVAIVNVLKAMNSIFTDLSYNICFHLPPMRHESGNPDSNRTKSSKPNSNWHFYMQIIPRVGTLAGFELSTGCYINSKNPADAAKELRHFI